LRTDLESEAAAGEGYESRIAPCVVLIPNNQDAFAASRTKTESHLDNVRNHRNGIGACEQRWRNGLLRNSQELVEHVGCVRNAFFLLGRGVSRHADQQCQQQKGRT
jgi:hypothetical protein